MKKYLWRISACAIVAVAASQGIIPIRCFADVGSVQIVITDNGFVPNKMNAVIDRQIKIHVVNKGQKVHQFSIPYYRIYTRDLGPGQTSDIAFSPWSVGKFDITSDPSGTENPEFRGNLVVSKE